MKYYIPPKKPSRGDDESDGKPHNQTTGTAGAIRDIVSKGGPMSEGKKSVAFSTAGKGGPSDKSGDKARERDIKLLELAAICERPDVGNAAFNAPLDKVYLGRKKMRDRIAVDSPIDHRSRASKRSNQRRGTIKAANQSGGFGSINESMVESNKEQNTLETSHIGGNLTMNKTLIGKLSSKMEAKNFSTEYSQVEKTLKLLGADIYDTCEDIAMLSLNVTKTMERTRV